MSNLEKFVKSIYRDAKLISIPIYNIKYYSICSHSFVDISHKNITYTSAFNMRDKVSGWFSTPLEAWADAKIKILQTMEKRMME